MSIQRESTARLDALPTLDDVLGAAERVSPHIHRTPVFHSRLLSEATGYRVFLKAEMLQRGGSYKIRGPLNKLPQLSQPERDRGVICSSAGNHAQGVALAAAIHGVQAVVVMAENATPAKVAATKAYGAEVIQYGSIWDEANAKALELAAERGLTFVHPFDDTQLICGQGTLGLELVEQCPDLDVVVVPIGGGGLISGVSTSVKGMLPQSYVVGVESSDGPAMKCSIEVGHVVELEDISTVIDGLRVKRVGDLTYEVVRQRVDEIVTLPDREIFDAVLWVMSRTKLLVEGAAAATVGALLGGLVRAEPGSTVVCVLSGGNVNLDDLHGRPWN
jgi:threonine dehydratase